MKVYKELIIQGTERALFEFQNKIGDFSTNDWERIRGRRDLKDKFVVFEYKGESVDKSQVFFYTANIKEKGLIKVTNIIPIAQDKSDLTIEEYNKILDLLYKDIVCRYIDPELSIELSKSDVFDPLTVFSKETLNKLKQFCSAANKSTGATHPLDRERWLDFVFTSYSKEETMDTETFANFLSDEEYWGKRTKYIMGECAWTEEWAWNLAGEYSLMIETLKNYSNWSK